MGLTRACDPDVAPPVARIWPWVLVNLLMVVALAAWVAFFWWAGGDPVRVAREQLGFQVLPFAALVVVLHRRLDAHPKASALGRASAVGVALGALHATVMTGLILAGGWPAPEFLWAQLANAAIGGFLAIVLWRSAVRPGPDDKPSTPEQAPLAAPAPIEAGPAVPAATGTVWMTAGEAASGAPGSVTVNSGQIRSPDGGIEGPQDGHGRASGLTYRE